MGIKCLFVLLQLFEVNIGDVEQIYCASEVSWFKFDWKYAENVAKKTFAANKCIYVWCTAWNSTDMPHATCNQMSESSPFPVIWKELKINYADLITLLLERLEQFIDFEVYLSQYKIWTARVLFAFLLTSKLLIYLKTKCNTTHAEWRKSPKANRCPTIWVGS